MVSPRFVKVIAQDGTTGIIDTEAWPLDGSKEQVMVQLADGRRLLVPLNCLAHEPSGEYKYKLKIDCGKLPAGQGQELMVIPVVHEKAEVGKRAVETGRVRVTKVVREEEEIVDQPLHHTDVHVERVPVNRPVEGPLPVRQLGETVIVPVVEEVLTVQKQWMLKEELHITRRTSEHHEPQRVVVRREEAHVQRVDVPGEK